GLARPALVSLSAARGLQALAPSSVLQMRVRNSLLLAALGEFVREVPSYELRLCPDPAANAAAVAEGVDRLGLSAGGPGEPRSRRGAVSRRGDRERAGTDASLPPGDRRRQRLERRQRRGRPSLRAGRGGPL